MARLKPLRALHLSAASGAGRAPFVSAASGLVAVGKWLYVIADDELHLGLFPAEGKAPGTLVRLLPGKLPRGKKKRKAKKADFEALALLPAFAGCPQGALLALGSGSRSRRRRGVLLPLDSAGLTGEPRIIDLSGLYRELERQLEEVNVEGAVVLGKHLCLLNRGHPRHGGSAVIRLTLRAVLRSIARSDSLEPLPCKVRRYDLGDVDGVPLGFTDGAALPDGSLVFTAVAERADDSYQDGTCVASAVGLIGPDGELGQIRWLRPPRKVEGIVARRQGRRTQLILVTDADDARVPAGMYGAEFPGRSTVAQKKETPAASRRPVTTGRRRPG